MIASEEKKKILIVDDSETVVKSLKHFLEYYGFIIISCNDGLEGIQCAVEHKPDLILLDLMMPNLDGIKTLQVKRVVKDIQDIPVIVISANTGRSNVLAAAEAGAERVITKPIKKEAIIKYINEIFGKDYFANPKKETDEEDKEYEDIKQNLKHFFVKNFAEKKKDITETLMKRDSEKFKRAIHDLKGSGGTVGEDEITSLSAAILEKELNTSSDWAFAEMNFNKILQKVEKLKTEIK
ncbi:MAG: response regulator [Melioribacteraceae bacterium]|nr:response regulator [Melioribacteraceae bacterium]MCF8355166.1 response regulator [Melioribacteraceae bacterium]MCF8392495.1 response regulator [Melioribacteraceae bacterium]MCF8418406.1 response regulator [Melioribacteraceae bacterium]